MNSAITRARALLTRSGAWLTAEDGGYALRLGPDRRSRVHLRIDEAAFAALTEAPGLSIRPGGGWMRRLSAASAQIAADQARDGPGLTRGDRAFIQADGRMTARRANLTPTAIAWLAARRDPQGRPWLTQAQVAAGARLTAEAETALKGAAVTMRWDALPRSGSGGQAPGEPSGRALAAGRRIEAALRACGPARGVITAVCIRGTALQAAEHALGLRRREGRLLLQQGLGALAAHYRLG